MSITRQSFGRLSDGRNVEIFTLSGAGGVQARITNYGAIIVAVIAPDSAGRLADVCLGCDTLDGYLADTPYFGAVCGRYANRIAGGRFALGGREYALARNNGANSLHGGAVGFDKKLWDAAVVDSPRGEGLELTCLSPDCEEGYPGNLRVKVVYSLSGRGELAIDYFAVTDRDTVVNLTNHAYFNLAGQASGDILDHELTLHASRFTPIDAGLIPTGELRDVGGTPMDFRRPAIIGARIDADDEQLRLGRGYDHNWVLDRTGAGLELAARVRHPASGRVLEVLTTEPGIQFYTGNFLDGSVVGKAGHRYCHCGGLCLETQHFPDSPNHPNFPSTALKPGQPYRQTTIYRFSA